MPVVSVELTAFPGAVHIETTLDVPPECVEEPTGFTDETAVADWFLGNPHVLHQVFGDTAPAITSVAVLAVVAPTDAWDTQPCVHAAG